MKYALIGISLLLVGVIGIQVFNLQNRQSQESAQNGGDIQAVVDDSGIPNVVGITPISHASLVLTWGNDVVYVDPVGGASAYAASPPATIVLVTDVHGDHLNEETLRAVMRSDTYLIAPQSVIDELTTPPSADRILVMANGETATYNAFSIEAVPMYNTEGQGLEQIRHEKGRGNGYVLERDDVRLYIAGDTGPTDEMKALKDIDIAFVPMNLPYTMSVEDAAEATLAFAPKRVYPYHYRTPEGFSDVNEFKRLVNEGNPAIDVVLLEWYQANAVDEE